MSWEKAVFSSNVQAIGYDENTKDLIVTWKNGKRSAYNGVPEELADEVSRAPSVGTMLNSDIKPNYPHRYV
jgi:hypothetical protein